MSRPIAFRSRKSNGVPVTSAWDELGVHHREGVGRDAENVIVDRPAALTGQVEVGVLGQVDDGRASVVSL